MRPLAVALGFWAAFAVPNPPVLGAELPVPENYGQAMGWYERAATAGNAKAQYYLGIMLETGVRGAPDPARAVVWFRKAAEQGHLEAQYRLALIYQQGRSAGQKSGVARDLAEAARWFRMAAEAGLAQAQFNLALMYEGGWGVERNAAEAVLWYEQAAAQGVAEAWLQLGLLYAEGGGVRRDPVRALMWLEMAAARGIEVRAGFRESLTRVMTPAQIAEARSAAREKLERLGRAIAFQI